MTKQQIKIYLQSLERKLIANSRLQRIQLTREWTKQFPKEAGVYIISENDTICYVGETGSIRARMNNLRNTQNHVLRRNIGNKKFTATPGFQKATSHRKFNPEIESKLNNWIKRNLKVSTLVVDLGRKELEEYLFEKHKPKYNSKGKRT
jgi:hypothetical protein